MGGYIEDEMLELGQVAPSSHWPYANSSLLKKLNKLMGKVGVVQKDGTNKFHHYRYASAAATLGVIRPALVELGLVSVQNMSIIPSDGPAVTVRCVLRIFDVDSGESIDAVGLGSGMDSGDKAVMKAETAAHKYAWWHLLNISTEDDPEADPMTDAITSPAGNDPQPKTPEQRTLTAKVKSVGKASPNPRSPYLISTDKGDFKTFDKDLATAAELAFGSGMEMEFTYTVSKWGRDLVSRPKNKES